LKRKKEKCLVGGNRAEGKNLRVVKSLTEKEGKSIGLKRQQWVKRVRLCTTQKSELEERIGTVKWGGGGKRLVSLTEDQRLKKKTVKDADRKGGRETFRTAESILGAK